MERLVEELDLDFRHFHCCGDEDLYPFGCPKCGHLMVFCYECDTLHDDWNDLSTRPTRVNHSDIDLPIFACPKCKFEFEYFFIRDQKYKVQLSVWRENGFGFLLADGENAS